MISRKFKLKHPLMKGCKTYKLIADYASDKIFRTSPDGTYLFASPSCETLIGYGPDELVGKNVADFIYTEDCERIKSSYLEALDKNEDTYSVELRLKRKRGDTVWVETKARLIKDREGNLKEVISVTRDITDRKNNERRLRESEQFYKSLFTYSPDSIVVFDLEGNFIDGNDATEKLLGYSIEELKQTHFINLVVPEDIDRSLHRFEKSKHGVPQSYQIGLIHKNGERVEIEATKIPVIVDGQIVGVHAYAKNITERNRILKEIQESEERYRSLVELSPEMIVVITDDKVVYINEVGLKIIGANSKVDVIGKQVLEFLPPDERKIAEKQLKSLKKGKKHHVHHKLVRLDGKIIDVDIVGVPVTFLGKPSIQMVVSDITTWKLNEELLFKAEKLNVVGQLAAGVAHELRNPLTSLKGFLYLLKLREANDAESTKYMEIMSSEFNRIEQIINEFLVLSKPTVSKYENHDIRELLENTIDLIGTQASLNNVMIVRDYDSGMHVLQCDGNQLKQVFINVIKNAIEAMPNGGVVRVVTEVVSDQQITASIIDEGVGIDSKRIERLGEPFYSTKEKGTGLGLMVCHQIVRNHNGKLTIKSVLGEGTTVKISLPVLKTHELKKKTFA